MMPQEMRRGQDIRRGGWRFRFLTALRGGLSFWWNSTNLPGDNAQCRPPCFILKKKVGDRSYGFRKRSRVWSMERQESLVASATTTSLASEIITGR